MKNGSLKNNHQIAKQFFFQKGIRNEALKRLSLLISFAVIISASLLVGSKPTLSSAVGHFFVVSLLLFILYKDLMRYKPGIAKNYKMLILIGLLLATNLITGRVFYYILDGYTKWLGYIDPSVVVYAIPLATGAMLAALLVNIHTAIVFAFITSLLAGLWHGSPLYSIFVFVGGITAAFSVIRCKKRSALLMAGLLVSIVSVVTALVITLIKGQLFAIEFPVSIALAFSNGIIVAALASALLPLHEHLFNLSTDMSLLEHLDLNQPLMRNLLIEAPGTYHHSIIVGNLVEAAAEAVGVNPLLARVSSYYHDIGKMRMPEYFVENQQGPVSRHEKLTPNMSSLILISHVKEGVELARLYKLPDAIIDIIQQHHGASLIAYFYQKAKEQHEPSDSPIAETDFRYPGPRPQTRVAALVMMADAVEAASRVLTDPTPARISALVDKIINHVFLDGQLDECELTLKDLQEIKKHFTHILTAVFHRRIDYPGFEIRDEDSNKEPAKTYKSKQDKDRKDSPEDISYLRTPQG